MTITEKELSEKLFREWTQGDDEQLDGGWDRVARTAAELLGVELAPEKPAPGTAGWHADTQRPAYVDERGAWRVIMANGEAVYVDDAHRLPVPARVVPAAPVELTEEDLVAAYPDGVPYAYGGFINFPGADRRALLLMTQNLLAKHAHAAPVELPTRKQVRDAIEGAGIYGRTKVSVDDATHAVMALLEGGQK